MHSNNFVIAVKHQGRVLREHVDLVTLPFGAEYSLYLKNLNSVRAMATVTIDGQSVTDGCKLIIPANDSIELERFIKGGNLHSGNRLKFIERNAAVEQHRGIGAEDGLVRVEFWREQPAPVWTSVHHYYDTWHPNRPPYFPHPYKLGGNITYGSNCHSSIAHDSGFRSFNSTGGETLRSASCNFMQQSIGNAQAGVGQNATPTNDAGITVGGSHSSQSFSSSLGFPVEAASTVLTLRLRGEVAGKPVTQPVVVNQNVSCGTCGLSSRSSAQFCSRCGAGLIRY